MTRARPNVRRQWFYCENCTLDFMGTQAGLCPHCHSLSPLTPWRDVPRTGRWVVYGLVLLAVLFLLRMAGDLVTMVKGWLS